MVHDGVMRRSDAVLSETTWSGISAMAERLKGVQRKASWTDA
jgi:hypothetical protein